MTLMKISGKSWLIIWVVMLLSGCKVYKQDILFRLDENFTEEDLAQPMADAQKNYELKVNDYIQLQVSTNKGERIIDPNNELSQGMNVQQQNRQQFDYLIQMDSMARLPIVGEVKLAGLTINEAELLLQEYYNEHYKESFVKVTVSNRRVTILGANGGQVITLPNENMTLAEVLALYGGTQMGTRAGNIRLIRGDLENPQVFLIDLTTISGMRATITSVQPGDILYVEPWRRPWLQALRDISPVLSITSSVIAFVLVIQNLSR